MRKDKNSGKDKLDKRKLGDIKKPTKKRRPVAVIPKATYSISLCLKVTVEDQKPLLNRCAGSSCYLQGT